jgi:hypothetical protein
LEKATSLDVEDIDINNFENSHNYLNYFPEHNIEKFIGSLNIKAKVHRR